VFWLRFYELSYEAFCARQAEVALWLDAAGVPAAPERRPSRTRADDQ
jgi:hypothetical protein